MDLAALDRVMSVNFRGAAACVKHAARAMVSRGTARHRVHGERGVVPGRVRAGGVHGVEARGAGAGARGGRRARAARRARELRVPGGVATPLSCGLTGMSPEEMEAAAEPHNVLRGKVLKAADVAEAMLFLASDQAAFVSGHNLVVDGATTAVNYAVLQSVGL